MSKIPYEAPFAGTVAAPVTENDKMVTGNWRMVRPVLDKERCTNCLICWIYCPDSCINAGGEVISFNYKYCKGCGICRAVCPINAITEVPELEFED